MGVITLDSKPLAETMVSFSPKVSGEGMPGYALTNENGEYKLQTFLGNPDAGTTPGEYIVFFSKTISVPTGKKLESTDQAGRPITIDDTIPEETLPNVYTSSRTTPFSVVVKKGRNVMDFALESNKK